MKAHRYNRICFILLLLLCSPSIFAGKIYKWTDEKGRVHFGDNPSESERVKEVKIPTQRLPLKHAEAVHNDSLDLSYKKSKNKKKPFLSSFGENPPQEIKTLNGELKKRKGVDVIERPILANMVFPECDPNNLKPGTGRSGLCDLWDKHLTYLNDRLKNECVVAGENIYKTVTNVDGVFLNSPQMDAENQNRSFKNTGLHRIASQSIRKYISPRTARLYRQFEYYDSQKKVYVTKKITVIEKGIMSNKRRRLIKVDTSSTEPQSRFEVSYKHITTEDDHRQGFYGDLTWVKDRKTNETLAERRIYYFTIQRNTLMVDGTYLKIPGGRNKYRRDYDDIPFFYPCEDYIPRVTRFEEDHPRNEYEFVSRVLIPTPFTQDENNLLYDFSIANTTWSHSSTGVQTAGPGITPENLQVTHIEDDLKLSIRGKKGSLTFRDFFLGGGTSHDFKLLFADGQMMKEKQIFDYGGISWKQIRESIERKYNP